MSASYGSARLRSAAGLLRTMAVLLTRRLPRLRKRLSIVWITPSLAQGPRFTSAQVGALVRSGVDSVLDVRKEGRDDEELLARHGLRLYHVPMVDMAPPTQNQLKQAVEWVMGELASDRKVYIHCRSGVGRSVCVACAVLVRMGYGLPEAYEAVRRRRPEAVVSERQVGALRRYAESVSRPLTTRRSPKTPRP